VIILSGCHFLSSNSERIFVLENVDHLEYNFPDQSKLLHSVAGILHILPEVCIGDAGGCNRLPVVIVIKIMSTTIYSEFQGFRS
jgi:hypothetical protein